MSSNFAQPASPLHNKLQSLESLRGLAALTVVLSHLRLAFWWSNATDVSPPLWGLWHNGDFAVRLFFVLSGFVLSRSFFCTCDAAVVRSAAVRRYFRLAVPTSSSVLFAYLLCISGAMHNHELAEQIQDAPNPWLHSFYQSSPTAWNALREAFYGAYFDFQYKTSFNVVLWTMAVELQGSFLIFSFLALFGTSHHRNVLYPLSALLMDSLQLKFMTDFIVGMALCDWHVANPRSEQSQMKWIVLFVIGLCLGDLRSSWVNRLGLGSYVRGTRIWPTIAAAFMIVGATRSRSIQKILSMRPLAMLGPLSFYLYLMHLPLICSLGAQVYCGLRAVAWSHPSSAAVACLACLVSSFAAAQFGLTTLDRWSSQLGRLALSLLYPAAASTSDHDRRIAGPESGLRPSTQHHYQDDELSVA